jgi:hypothetical protein
MLSCSISPSSYSTYAEKHILFSIPSTITISYQPEL